VQASINYLQGGYAEKLTIDQLTVTTIKSTMRTNNILMLLSVCAPYKWGKGTVEFCVGSSLLIALNGSSSKRVNYDIVEVPELKFGNDSGNLKRLNWIGYFSVGYRTKSGLGIHVAAHVPVTNSAKYAAQQMNIGTCALSWFLFGNK
jgi:hypothetical protein